MKVSAVLLAGTFFIKYQTNHLTFKLYTMKNIFFTLLFLLYFNSAFSQEFISLDIEMPEEFPADPYAPFAYNALALNDGDFVFTQSIYDFDNERDCGVRFVKMSPQGKIIGDIFYEFKIEGSIDYPNSKLINNPYNENEFIYTYFSYGETCYYNAVFLDNSLNITEEISKQFDESGITTSHMPFLNMDNNFIYVWVETSEESEKEYKIVEADIYGNIIKSSVLMEYTGSLWAYIYSFFIYDKEKKQYGFITDIDGNNQVFNIIDKDLNFVESYPLSGYDGYKINGNNGYGCVAKMDDGTFAFMQYFYSSSNYYDRFLQLCKMDKKFKIIDKNILNYDGDDIYSIDKEYKDILKCKDGSLYCIWSEAYDPGDYNLHVGYFDKDLNLLWKRCCKEGMSCFGNYTGIDILENGGLVLAGNNTGSWGIVGTYSSVIIFENNGTAISENPNNIRPYSFYPNPANDVINISFSPDVNAEKVEIYGLDGKMYHEQNFNLETVNINDLSNGVYMMKVVLDNGTTFNDKIVVK